MALSYKTGAQVTYSLVATANSGNPFSVQIVGASYGDDTADVTIAANGLSVSITVQAGTDNLILTVVSPNQNDEAELTEGGNVRFVFRLTEHWDGCKLEITGT
jgi:hypothetical protein